MKTEKRKSINSRQLGIAASLTAASAVTGLSYRAIQAAKNAGCPHVKPSGRVNCDALLRWLGDNPDCLESAGERVNLDLEIALRTRADRETRELRLAVLRGQYTLTSEVEQDTANLIAMAKSVLLTGPASLAPQVVGMSIPEAEKLLREWIYSALSKLSANPLGTKSN